MLFRQSKLLIAALTKNNARWIAQVLKNIEMYASCFNDYECVFIDGNSSDATAVILKGWCKVDPNKRTVVQENTLFTSSDKAVNDRMNLLTNARNSVIDIFRDQFTDHTFLLLLDADSVNAKPLDIAGFMSCEQAFEDNDKCAALFANQPTVYYDVWALRDSKCQIDWQIEWRLCGDVNCHKKYQTRKDPTLGLWPVKSAFGGAGLYRTSLIPQNAKYTCTQIWRAPVGIDYTLPICEHVPFNESIGASNGAKLYINCRWMINDHE
jgi:hypothetical protein